MQLEKLARAGFLLRCEIGALQLQHVHDLFYFKMTLSASSQAGQLFIAILPDAETSAQIHRMAAVMKTAHAFRGQLTAPDRLHVTLFSLGGLPDQLVAKACEAIGEVWAEPFEISFDRSMSFRGQPGSRAGRQRRPEAVESIPAGARRGICTKEWPATSRPPRFHAAYHAAL